MILFVFCCVLSSSLILLILSLTLLGLGSRCTSLSPEDRWGRSMWLVSCRRQGMLTQGCASDLKCKLNNSSLLTLLYPLDCLICAKDIMNIVLLLQMMQGGKVGEWFIYVGVWVGGQNVRSYFFIFYCFLCCF